jgi:hypothetical protein
VWWADDGGNRGLTAKWSTYRRTREEAEADAPADCVCSSVVNISVKPAKRRFDSDQLDAMIKALRA